MNHFRILKAALLGLPILYVPLALGGAGAIGRVDFSQGMVKALQLNEQPRVLSANGDLFLNDLVETGDHSFALLKFIDDGKAMVRPNSIFSVSKYSEERKEVRMDLVKGGVTVETGRIAADNPSNLTLDTPLVQINAQQAKIKIRLCKKDCAEESLGANANGELPQEVVGRVVDQRGETYAQSQEVRRGKEKRPLVLGSPVYRSDYLLTGADGYLLVVFVDGGRTALDANSKLLVEDYHYQEKGVKDKAFLRLVRGSLRAVSGQVGKADHNDYSLLTPVATIGIRGTAFNLVCNCGCGEAPGAKPGLFGLVRNGAIQLENGAGSQLVAEGQVAYIPGWQGKIEALDLAQAPDDVAASGVPAPEEKPVDMKALFGKEELQGIPPGLYLTLEDGFMRLTGKEGEGRGTVLDLGRNETAFIDTNGKMIRISNPKGFQLKDENPVPPKAVN